MSQRAAQTNNLDCSEPCTPVVNGPVDLWSDVHELVQRRLAELETEVRRKAPDIQVRQGRTHGKQFHLFSYKTFTAPNSPEDPVVGGITFSRTEHGVKIEADISAERTGDLIYAAPSKDVLDCREEILKAADEVARVLCQSADAIGTKFRAGMSS
jgi:hypothetical protein